MKNKPFNPLDHELSVANENTEEEVGFDEELYKEIGQILQVKPLYVKPGLTEEQKKQGYLVHVASTLTEMFQEKLAHEKQKSYDEGLNYAVKLLESLQHTKDGQSIIYMNDVRRVLKQLEKQK